MPWMIIAFLTGVLAGGALGLLGAWFALYLKPDEGDELHGLRRQGFPGAVPADARQGTESE